MTATIGLVLRAFGVSHRVAVAGVGSQGNLARSHDGRLASGRVLSGFRIVATLPVKRTPQNASEPLDGVVGIRGLAVPISGNAA